jgi:hypothetical protein
MEVEVTVMDGNAYPSFEAAMFAVSVAVVLWWTMAL